MVTKLTSRAGLLAAGVAMATLAITAPVYAGGAVESLPELKIDQAKAELGKRLFFDRRLSGNAAIACSDCHQPDSGFGSKEALSPGYPGNGHFRNSPSLINTAHKKTWFHDGRMGTSLNDVTREMITETYIMNMDMRIMQERLKQDPVYLDLFKKAGYGEPSNGKVRKALPEYMKTLTSRNAPADTGNMSTSAKNGMALFNGKAGCAQCHSGPLLSDGKAHNTGVAENLDIFLDPMNHQAFLGFIMWQGVPNEMHLKRDPGHMIVTLDEADTGKFMTPGLRELKYTAPYMHNGMIKTLDEVIEFYNNGGGQDSRKDPALQKLGLGAQEKKDLVAFLQALSGDPLTSAEHVWKDSYPAEYPVIPNWTEARN